MKKITLILALLSSIGWAQGQTYDSIPAHFISPHQLQTAHVSQLADGNLAASFLLAVTQGGYVTSAYGSVMHKVTRHGCQITDTAFSRHEYLPSQYIFRAPDGNGNILAELGNNKDLRTQLRIRRFDDNLEFDAASDVTVTLPSTHITPFETGILLNPHGDLVLTYYNWDGVWEDSVFFAQYGFDGTLKHQRHYREDEMSFHGGGILVGPQLFSTSPLRYCCCGTKRDNNGFQHLQVYILDSLFGIEKHHVLQRDPVANNGVCFEFGLLNNILALDGGDFLLGFQYETMFPNNPWWDKGVMVRKYDEEFNLLGEAKFLSDPPQQGAVEDFPIGLRRGADGCVYFAYTTPFLNRTNHVVVVKMDEDLNVIWKKNCMFANGFGRTKAMMTVLDDNAVAITGVNSRFGEVFYVIINDDYDAMEEQGVIVRPYAFWPNPARDELRLQYSPDAKPAQAELYDLQGRLVRQQRTGLETLNLEGLAPGTYTLRVTLEGGKTFSDKVVKE